MVAPFPEAPSKILIRKFDGETYVRLRLDIEGAPLHQAITPETASRALKAAGIRFLTVKPGDYWISIWDHEKAHLALYVTAEPDRAREAIADKLRPLLDTAIDKRW